HLLLFLLLYRLFTRRSLRDARDVGFLSFLMLVAGAAVTFGVEFLFVFLAFLVLGVWVFMLHHVLSEAEPAAAPDDRPPVAAARELLPDLRWRGSVFDRFDGRGWSVGPDRAKVVRSAPGQFDVARYRGTGTLLVQEIYLEPLGTEIVFAAPRLLRLAVRTDS